MHARSHERLTAAQTASGALDSRLDAVEADLSTRLTDAQLSAHAADTTGVHGIIDTGLLVVTSDARLTDQRTPLDTSAKGLSEQGRHGCHPVDADPRHWGSASRRW